jgi:hypothetical protein
MPHDKPLGSITATIAGRPSLIIRRRCLLAPDIRSATDLNAAGGDVAHLDAIGVRSDVNRAQRLKAIS